MTVRIEAGKIKVDKSICKFYRNMLIETEEGHSALRIDADTKEELEIIDQEDFRYGVSI